jgi:hypothetical protein
MLSHKAWVDAGAGVQDGPMQPCQYEVLPVSSHGVGGVPAEAADLPESQTIEAHDSVEEAGSACISR